VVVIFLATWCPNCAKELPHLRHLIQATGPRGAVFLGVANPEDKENTDTVENYFKKNHLDFLDVALDPEEASWAPYHVVGYPSGVLIDRKGIIRWRGHPAFLLKSLVEKLIDER
jgi:thiol-disulfide isomerase/thioredoxin